MMVRRAAELLCLAAAPTFALIALISGVSEGDAAGMLCSATRGSLQVSGMVPMYLLMSIFHVSPWLKLASRRRMPN